MHQDSAHSCTGGQAANQSPRNSCVQTGGRRTAEQLDLDLPSGCEDEEMSDGQGPGSADESDSDTEPIRKVIQPNGYLRGGMVFRGKQRVCQPGSGASSVREEQWDVGVTIQEIDFGRGSCSGSMLANPIFKEDKPVTTHWTGEIIDDINNSFVTCKWGASYTVDMSHWRKFKAFGPLRKRVGRLRGRCSKLHELPVVFMRWKERFFIGRSGEGCDLTIAGFYYICLCRESGKIEGYYFDPSSMPYQKLELQPRWPGTYHTSRTLL